MAKGMYVGVGGKARKIKKAYVGIGGKARKIKKGYVGIGGVARCFWSAEGVDYYGTATPLSAGRYDSTGANVGDYALFAGGQITSPSFKNFANVDAYNSQLVYSAAPNLSSSRSFMSTGNIGGYVLFAGGSYNNINSSNHETIYSGVVDVYNQNLVKPSAAVAGVVARNSIGNSSVGGYTLFAGGYTYTEGSAYGKAYSDVDVYDSKLSRKTASLSAPKCDVGGAKTSDYALFAGGLSPSNSNIYYDTVDAFSSNLTRTIAPNSSIKAANRGGANINGFAVFAGGKSQSSTYNTVEYYTNSLVKNTALPLSQPQSVQGLSDSDRIIFIGNQTTEIYNKNLSKIAILSAPKKGIRTTIAWTNHYILTTDYQSVSVYIVN